MASVFDRITSALSSLGKRRDRESGASDVGASPGGRSAKRFRPWEQSDLHKRLETYKDLTWWRKPASVGPVPCALRGWTNTGIDTLRCEYCNATLIYPPNVAFNQREEAADKFSPCLVSKHANGCPWRQTACDQSLLAYAPNSSNDELCSLFSSLQDKLLKVDVLPDLDAIAIRAVRDAAMPYGPYDDLVLGDAGAIVPARRPPSVRILDDGGADGGGASASAAGGGAADDPAAGATFIVQPSKLTPAQKARLLALLGWDIDVLEPGSASGVAAAPYAQASGYSLQHLGVRTKKAGSASGGAAGTAAATAAGGSGESGGKYPMSCVALKCRHCSHRMGLWNFAGVRPVPTGRLTPAQQAAGAAALLSPRAASGGGAAAAVASSAAAAAAAADPLSVTIAGGQYGLHGAGGLRPFGAASAAPFRFGSAASAQPVFGITALDPANGSTPAAPSSASAGGFGSFGSPLGSPAPAPRPPTGAQTPAAAAGGSRVAFSLTGQKRKAEDQAGPAPMALDLEQAADGGKRQRVGSTPPLPVRSPYRLGPGGDGEPLELDPVGQHRSWCPWVYAGTCEEPKMSGWQHMLSALAAQQRQRQDNEAVAAAAAGGAVVASPGGSGRDARQLRDAALAATRAL
ncbi:hypothetical protein GPECTOR_202g375 [Gonium pectorale]|uniref:C3HC-type domain-containing protein n=1 Tax=Gonium pectorale TaxID=33097 RepID=A0A150FWX6_GONPE|nr:hypothetical protein GPECTOR_202g375 [Gonium pectorale]|eukprot:KXZ42113.1 hypothetical protein GPECTOR_202g375 [Gonium pectorale]